MEEYTDKIRLIKSYAKRLKRLKEAHLPLLHIPDQYDHSVSNGLTKTQLNQLRELHWIEEGFNLMLSGPSGVGKTYIAAGLCSDAINKGYKAYFRSMDEILTPQRGQPAVLVHKQHL